MSAKLFSELKLVTDNVLSILNHLRFSGFMPTLRSGSNPSPMRQLAGYIDARNYPRRFGLHEIFKCVYLGIWLQAYTQLPRMQSRQCGARPNNPPSTKYPSLIFPYKVPPILHLVIPITALKTSSSFFMKCKHMEPLAFFTGHWPDYCCLQYELCRLSPVTTNDACCPSASVKTVLTVRNFQCMAIDFFWFLIAVAKSF